MLDSLLKKLLQRRSPQRYSRRWPRIALSQAAQVRLSNGLGQAVVVNQLSVAGARIQSESALREGDNVELRLGEAPSATAAGECSLLARIVYSCKERDGYYFGSGLCFLGLAPSDAAWLAAYISAQQARRRKP